MGKRAKGGPGVRVAARLRARRSGIDVARIEKMWNQRVRQTGPEAWAALVAVSSEREVVRLKVAQIVWWDHFGLRPHVSRWPHLDAYLKLWAQGVRKGGVTEPPPQQVKEALMRIGYPEWIAEGRLA